MQQLLDKGSTKIDIIKRGRQQNELIISTLGASIIIHYAQVFLKLMSDKQLQDPLLTTQKVIDKALDHTSYDKEINTLLKEMSLKCDIHWRSHSFRATFITDLLQSQPMKTVSQIIVHSSICTTAIYDRYKL